MKFVVPAVLLLLVGCVPPPPPPPPLQMPPVVSYAPIPPRPAYVEPPRITEAPITTTRRHRGVTVVSSRCPAGMHWQASSRKVVTYIQGGREVKVSKRKAGYCAS